MLGLVLALGRCWAPSSEISKVIPTKYLQVLAILLAGSPGKVRVCPESLAPAVKPASSRVLGRDAAIRITYLGLDVVTHSLLGV